MVKRVRKGSTPMDEGKPADLEQSQTPEPAEESAEAPELDPIEALQREVAELRDQNLRQLADTRNLQQRAQREKAEAIKYAEADFARELLVILDDLERTQESARNAENVQAVADGVRIVYEHYLKVLKGRQIEPIEALGQPFDPSLHEAMLQQPSDEYAAGTVMQELARGYKMHERVLRASRVIVSSGPAQESGENAEAPSAGSEE